MTEAATQQGNARDGSAAQLLARLGNRSIVFIGMMGCGKSAIGQLVASELGLPYFDSDREIVSAANLEIPEIFERHGEAYFRAGEERVIRRLLSQGPAVISLGGGAFISQATRARVARKAISVWLTADVDLLLSRVLRRPGTRPLLQTGDPRSTLVELMEKRQPIYAQADIHVESSRSSKAHTRDAVIGALEAYLSSRQERPSQTRSAERHEDDNG